MTNIFGLFSFFDAMKYHECIWYPPTKAVIEFVEGRKQSIFFVWLNGSWNQQQ